MNDFESTIKQLLNDNVDTTLGPCRPAPPLDVTASNQRGFRPWLVPLVAAAGVAAAIAAIVVPARLFADRPAGGPDIRGPMASPSNSTYSAPETSGPNAPPPSPLPAAETAVDLGGAKLRLPVGWVADEVADPHQYGSSVYSREWCLAPARSASSPSADCPLQFGPVAPVSTSGVPVNGNVPLGTQLGGRQSSCPVSDFSGESSAGLPSLGQRGWLNRAWQGRCHEQPLSIQQYVVNTAPGYLLFSNQRTPELDAAMAEITQYASLPAQNAPLLLYDMGVVRAVTPQSIGYRMTIAPIIREGGNWMPSGEADRSYQISPAELKYALVGTKVGVTTDGAEVIDVGQPVSGW
jgi:hypothetical protein